MDLRLSQNHKIFQLFNNNYQGKYWFRNKYENGIMHCMHWLKDHKRPGEGDGAVFDPLTWPFWKGLIGQGRRDILSKDFFSLQIL